MSYKLILFASNSTLSYLHDISLRKPTCDSTIPLRQPLSANYREQRTRGKSSPATPVEITSSCSNTSFHTGQNLSKEIKNHYHNSCHGHNSLKYSRKSNNNSSHNNKEARQQRANTITSCGHNDQDHNWYNG